MSASRTEETSTITAKGQTTVPKSVRRALGVGYGGKIIYRIEGRHVSIHGAENEHRDPALMAFLDLVRKDLERGRNVSTLKPGLAAAMRKATADVPVDLDERLSGDVAI